MSNSNKLCSVKMAPLLKSRKNFWQPYSTKPDLEEPDLLLLLYGAGLKLEAQFTLQVFVLHQLACQMRIKARHLQRRQFQVFYGGICRECF